MQVWKTLRKVQDRYTNYNLLQNCQTNILKLLENTK